MLEVGGSTVSTFSHALDLLKKGHKVYRRGWNGKNMFLLLIDPYANTQYTIKEKAGMVGTLMPYIAIKTAESQLIPWLASQADLLAEDWVKVEEN